MTVSDIFKGITDSGFRAVDNLANKAILGDEQASRIALAREAKYYNGLNGSGAPNPDEAINDAEDGPAWYRNPFKSKGGIGVTVIGGILVLVLVVYLVARRK